MASVEALQALKDELQAELQAQLERIIGNRLAGEVGSCTYLEAVREEESGARGEAMSKGLRAKRGRGC